MDLPRRRTIVMDDEVVDMQAPTVFRSVPQALQILVRHPNPQPWRAIPRAAGSYRRRRRASHRLRSSSKFP